LTISVGAITNILNGTHADGECKLATTEAVSGKVLRFAFTSRKVIDEALWMQDVPGVHGTWQWQASDDAITWTNIGGNFTLGAASPDATQAMLTLNANRIGYYNYQLLGVSGVTDDTPSLREIEFRIDTYVPLVSSALSERQGSPIEEYSRTTSSASRVFIKDWADRHTVDWPLYYGYLWWDSTKITGQGLTGQDMSGNNEYESAIIEVGYAPNKGAQEADKHGLDPENWQVQRSYRVQHLTCPRRYLSWESDDSPTGKDQVRLEVETELSITRLNCPPELFPTIFFDAYRGMINDDVFLGYPAGTVLFLGAEESESITAGWATSGQYTLHFMVLNHDWRDTYRDDTGELDRAYFADNPGTYIYEEADLDALIV
jgi:hypothetical protein